MDTVDVNNIVWAQNSMSDGFVVLKTHRSNRGINQELSIHLC